MIVMRKAYICDWCGRTEYYDEEATLSDDFDNYSLNPDRNWVELPPPFGHTCPTCYSEVLSLYERIHAPVKAKELAKNTQSIMRLIYLFSYKRRKRK